MSWNRNIASTIDICFSQLPTVTSPLPSLPAVRPRHVCPTQIASDECRTPNGARVPSIQPRVRRRRLINVGASGAKTLKLQLR